MTLLLVCLSAQLGAPPLRPVAQASPVSSHNVAVVPSPAGEACCAGVMPTSGTVGGTGLSFNGFRFTNLPVASVSAATLASFDTLVLLQVQTGDLTTQQQTDMNKFVDAGHKLIIYDADATQGETYSWLLRPFVTASPCPNCGLLGGTLTIVESDTLGVGDPTSLYYVNAGEIPPNTDAVGDANVISTNDPNWFGQMKATNARSQTGWTHAYATSPSGHGLIIYNGLDTNFIFDASWSKSGINWLAKLWYLELAQPWDPSGLP